MSTTDRLELLKKQVIETSNLRNQIHEEQKNLSEIISYRESERDEKKTEMANLIQSVIGQNELSKEREKQYFKDMIEKFMYSQKVMNEEMIAINDNLADITSLKAVYDAKRELLEIDYNSQKEVLDKQIRSLSENIKEKENKINNLEREIRDTENKAEEANKELKKATFWKNFKNIFIDKWLIFCIIGFALVFVSGFFGWGVFSFFSWLFGIIKSTLFRG